ncbi:MAG: holo-ACP synthase [Fusobacteria bacterium]|nr:holo-ACP synthase [Fusobacteriota bacterium]
MDIKGIGTDIVKVKRLKKFIDRETLLHRTFTDNEINYALKHQDPLPSLAARFAVKEAIIKILKKVTILEAKNIEVLEKGQVRLSGEALKVMEIQGIREFKVSISHEKKYALAFVIGVG